MVVDVVHGGSTTAIGGVLKGVKRTRSKQNGTVEGAARASAVEMRAALSD